MMGTKKIGRLAAVVAAGMGLFQPGTGFGGGLNPNATNGPPALDFWSFSDTNYLTRHLRAPVSASNLVNVPYLGDGNALLLDSPNPAWLQYPHRRQW